MKIGVLDVNITADKMETVLKDIESVLQGSQPIFIVTPYSEMIVRAQKDREFNEVLNSATFALPDGIGILWAAHVNSKIKNQKSKFWRLFFILGSLFSIVFYPKLIRTPIPEKISGSEFIWDLTRLAADRGYSIFLLGGYDDIPDLAAAKLKSKFPNLKIVGTAAPVIASEPQGERGNLIHEINNSRPDFLFVALGPVTQEKWIAENLPKLNIKLAIGLGGTFDYLAGKRPPAPQIWAKLGLEWLWRLLTQPWRLWRISKGVLGLIWYTIRAKD